MNSVRKLKRAALNAKAYTSMEDRMREAQAELLSDIRAALENEEMWRAMTKKDAFLAFKELVKPVKVSGIPAVDGKNLARFMGGIHNAQPIDRLDLTEQEKQLLISQSKDTYLLAQQVQQHTRALKDQSLVLAGKLQRL